MASTKAKEIDKEGAQQVPFVFEELQGKIPVGIDNADTFAGGNVLDNKVVQKRRLTDSSFPYGVRIARATLIALAASTSYSVASAEAQNSAPAFGQSHWTVIGGALGLTQPARGGPPCWDWSFKRPAHAAGHFSVLE